MEGLLIFAALFGAAILLGMVKDKIFGSINTGLNRSVFQRGAYQDSAHLLGSKMWFRTTGDPTIIMDTLMSQAPLVPERPKINPDLYLVVRVDNAALICLGNFMEPQQICIELKVRPTDIPGVSEGSLEIPQWIEFDGVANGIRKTKELRRRIVQTIMNADPTAMIDGVPPWQYLAQHHS